MIIDLPLFQELAGFTRVVRAEIVNVAPHLDGVTWAVHKCPWSSTGMWKVSNIETGATVSIPRVYSKKEAIAEAMAYLATKTQANLDLAFDRMRKNAPTAFL